jgi:hypothetical protein
MIAGAPNEISGLESDLDVCFFQKKGSNALEAFDHWPQFNDPIEEPFLLVPASCQTRVSIRVWAPGQIWKAVYTRVYIRKFERSAKAPQLARCNTYFRGDVPREG